MNNRVQEQSPRGRSKTVKNNVPVIEYRIIKNKLSTICKIFFSTITDRDIKKKEIGTNNDIKPIDLYKISEA